MGLNIGGIAVIDVVDNVAGLVTNTGFLMFNVVKLVGTTYISDPGMVLGKVKKSIKF